MLLRASFNRIFSILVAFCPFRGAITAYAPLPSGKISKRKELQRSITGAWCYDIKIKLRSVFTLRQCISARKRTTAHIV